MKKRLIFVITAILMLLLCAGIAKQYSVKAAPKKFYKISFDTNGRGSTPPTVEVPEDADLIPYLKSMGLLKNLEDDGEYLFYGWGTENGNMDTAIYYALEKEWENAYDTLYVCEDMTLYAIWVREIKEVQFSIENPVCGEKTSVPKDGDEIFWGKVENPPKVTVKDTSFYDISRDENGVYLAWVRYGLGSTPFEGTFKGDKKYQADIEFTSKEGYIFTENTKITISNGLKADEIEMPFNHYFRLLINIKAVHKYGDWKTVVKPTETTEGKEKRSCSACGKSESRVIPKITVQSMHRLYNPNSGEHFYTSSTAEKDNLVSVGWKYEGEGWKAPSWSNVPVYRLYNPNAGDHHYSMSKAERDNLVAVGWSYEGIGWYSDEAKTVPLYRQYNPNATTGSHNYTTSKAENDHLVSLGWKEEGIGWYGK